MKILIVTQYFYPENFKSNDVAFEMAARGHQVTVMTGIPNYPQGKYYKGYGVLKNRSQHINGVKVIRVYQPARGRGGGVRLGLNYFTWAFLASVRMFFHSIRNKYDVIFVHEPSPITQGFPAIVMKKIRKTPIYFWVLDLWPESLSSAGGVTNRTILNLWEIIVTYIYEKSDKILISSRGFKESIISKGDFGEKIIYFPNWAENVFNNKELYEIPKLPEGFKILFAGNIGEAQDFDSILHALLLLKDEKKVKLILIGDGRKRKWVENFVKAKGLQNNVFVLGSFLLEAMPAFFKEADVLLVSLRDELIFNLTVPAKIQAYMASGKPILGMLNGEGAQIIKEAECGFCVNAGNAQGLAEIIRTISQLNSQELIELGENGKMYGEKHFSLKNCIEKLEEILQGHY